MNVFILAKLLFFTSLVEMKKTSSEDAILRKWRCLVVIFVFFLRHMGKKKGVRLYQLFI